MVDDRRSQQYEWNQGQRHEGYSTDALARRRDTDIIQSSLPRTGSEAARPDGLEKTSLVAVGDFDTIDSGTERPGWALFLLLSPQFFRADARFKS